MNYQALVQSIAALHTRSARILWVDIKDDKDLSLPYDIEVLFISRDKLNGLGNAAPQSLPSADAARPLTAVLRCKDLLDLFNTDPDLSGFDVDVSDYIRSSGTPDVQVFWRDFNGDPNTPKLHGKPDRTELCRVSIAQAKKEAPSTSNPCRSPAMSNNDSIDWRKTTFEGSRREELKRTQSMSVRQRLEALDELTELSERIQALSCKTGQVSDNHKTVNVHERHGCDPEGSDSVF